MGRRVVPAYDLASVDGKYTLQRIEDFTPYNPLSAEIQFHTPCISHLFSRVLNDCSNARDRASSKHNLENESGALHCTNKVTELPDIDSVTRNEPALKNNVVTKHGIAEAQACSFNAHTFLEEPCRQEAFATQNTIRKPGRKRVTFKPVFQKTNEPREDNHKSETRELRKPGEEVAFMFQTASGKPLGISTSALKKAKVVLGGDMCFDEFKCTTSSQNPSFPTRQFVSENERSQYLSIPHSDIKELHSNCAQVGPMNNVQTPIDKNLADGAFGSNENDCNLTSVASKTSSDIQIPGRKMKESNEADATKTYAPSFCTGSNQLAELAAAVGDTLCTVHQDYALQIQNPNTDSNFPTTDLITSIDSDFEQALSDMLLMKPTEETSEIHHSGNFEFSGKIETRTVSSNYDRGGLKHDNKSLDLSAEGFTTTTGEALNRQIKQAAVTNIMPESTAAKIVQGPLPGGNDCLETISNKNDNNPKTNAISKENDSKTFGFVKEDETEMNDSLNKLHASGNAFSMFQTAGGKPVTISASSLQKVFSIFKDDDNNDPLSIDNSSKISQIAPHNDVEASFLPLRTGEAVLVKNNIKSNVDNVNRGCNSKRKSYSECKDSSQRLSHTSLNAFPRREDGTNFIAVADNGLKTGNAMFSQNQLEQPLFQTGSGRTLKISADSMSRAKALFKDDCEDIPFPEIDIQNAAHEENCNLDFAQRCPQQSLFQTGSGKPLGVSADGIVKAKSLFDVGPGEIQFVEGLNDKNIGGTVNISSEAMQRAKDLLGIDGKNDLQCLDRVPSVKTDRRFANKTSPVLFQTGGGKLVRISDDAMKRARELLSEAEGETKNVEVMPRESANACFSSNTNCFRLAKVSKESSDKENIPSSRESEMESRSKLNETTLPSKSAGLKRLGKRKLCMGPLQDVKNVEHSLPSGNHREAVKPIAIHKPTPNKRSSVFQRSCTPFKQPRRNDFVSPYDECFGSSNVESKAPAFTKELPDTKFQFSYPASKSRKSLQDFFVIRPHHQPALWLLSSEIQKVTADTAQLYKFPKEGALADCNTGFQEFWDMLLKCGASKQFATLEWVKNHYKWIVWKLACLERSYAREAGGKFLTLQNVVQELKYRYEREINRGQRSPLKKIVEGDAAPGNMMVLCVSAIRSWPQEHASEILGIDPKQESNQTGKQKEISSIHKNHLGKVEITDGWYRLNAILDEGLSRQLKGGKIFVGQKLRICGASLCGWVGPLPPLEAFGTVNLMLHINGTYRAHWAERLSFCHGIPKPLAFRCIKEGGGPIPRTLVIVTRIYPTLYMERDSDRVCTIRSTRAEDRRLLLYNERRAGIVEDVVSKAEDENFGSPVDSDDERGEGGKIYSILENAAEPELLMADMTAAQLSAFAAYKRKREASRQASLEKHIQKALQDANLDDRQVTPFMRIRISGLIGKFVRDSCNVKTTNGGLRRDGLVTIWNPAEKQIANIEEGGIYSVSGLSPLVAKPSDNHHQNTIWFQANKSTQWNKLPQSTCELFDFTYIPRKAVPLSEIGEMPLNSEFDCAVLLLHVEEPYSYGFKMRQWLFVADGSSDGVSDQLETVLAIDVCLSNESFIPIDSTLLGSTVGFCNLVRKSRDAQTGLWIAEMTENSLHFSNFNLRRFSHLKSAAESVSKWGKVFTYTVKKLTHRVFDIVKKEA